MSKSSRPSRATRSMSSQPSVAATAPGPPIPTRDTSKTPQLAKDISHPTNPFQVDFVIPYDISLPKLDSDRARILKEVRDGYELLLRSLEGEGGLKIASRKGRGAKGTEEVWIFVGAGDEKIVELSERERQQDELHSLPPQNHPVPPSPATRIRLLHSLLTSPPVQQGLGITPGDGKWSRVKSIAALHDDEADKAWLKQWSLGGDWEVGLLKGLESEHAGLGAHQPPPVHLYFDFLTTYTLSLLPLSIVGAGFYLFTPADSYPPLFALILSLYSTIFVAFWRIRERKLAVRWGTRGCESVAVARLRPEYVANLEKRGQGTGGDVVATVQKGDDMKRDVKVATSVPVIAACGVGLGVLLMGVFLLEAFVSEIYEGLGQGIVPLIPTAVFVLVVPQIVGQYQRLAKALVKWEDHPTPTGADKSLTAKTFAMNSIVAYLGLFLSAYVYAPFGQFIMAAVQTRLTGYQGEKIKIASSAEKTGLGPRTSGAKQHSLKAGRLKGQLFAYTVTNQAVNAFLELGLPYILRFVDEIRNGKGSIKEEIQKKTQKLSEKDVQPRSDDEVEKLFLDKVEKELALPEYNLFTDYAEMVTQFGYVVVWSTVWPLAPVFALINNYIEIRGDALKVTQHVRRPVGDRVETIGSWLDTLSIISWIGALISSTLIYLFRPALKLASQSTPPSTDLPASGSIHLHSIISSYSDSPTLRKILPTLIPLIAVALAASHGHIVLRWVVESVMERVLWRGSEEEVEVQRMQDIRGGKGVMGKKNEIKAEKKKFDSDGLRGGFWNGGEEGAREVGRVGKTE